MKHDQDNMYKLARESLMADDAVVLPTDTVYGVVARALSERAVENIYRIRGRDYGKPCIVLVASEDQMRSFGCEIGDDVREVMDVLWDEKKSIEDKECFVRDFLSQDVTFHSNAFSIVVTCYDQRFDYVYRGTQSIAFRKPMHTPKLLSLISDVGPIVAPSANTQGVPTPQSINEIEEMFGENVALYIEGVSYVQDIRPSHVIAFVDGRVSVLR